MIGHKCDGCRYKGEHVEMGFKPFGVCYKEKNLIEAEKNYNAETCPYKYELPQLYKTEPEPEAEPVQWPKENPYLKPLPEIEETDNMADFNAQIEKLQRAAREAAENISRAIIAASEALRPIIKRLSETLSPILASLDFYSKIYECYPNKRVIYLAKHGKKRVRKKNINRIKKYFEREGKRRAVFAQN